MTDQPEHVTQPPVEPQVIRKMRVMLKTGGFIDVDTLLDFGMFHAMMIRDRCVSAPGLWIPVDNIAFIQQVQQGPTGTTSNIVQMKPTI